MIEPRHRLIDLGELRDDTTSTFRRSELPGPVGVVLRVLNRASEPRELHLLEGSCVVGAGREADLIVADETVSRRHLELSLVPEGVAVRDLGSHNGTYYLGQRLESAVLGIGSTIQLGRAELRLETDHESLAIGKPELLERYGELISGSPAVQKLFALLARLENSLVNVLIEGESGTGKELIARAIHQYSPAAAGKFVALNCAGMDSSAGAQRAFRAQARRLHRRARRAGRCLRSGGRRNAVPRRNQRAAARCAARALARARGRSRGAGGREQRAARQGEDRGRDQPGSRRRGPGRTLPGGFSISAWWSCTSRYRRCASALMT